MCHHRIDSLYPYLLPEKGEIWNFVMNKMYRRSVKAKKKNSKLLHHEFRITIRIKNPSHEGLFYSSASRAAF